MNAQTVGWLLILAVIKNFSSANIQYSFELADTHLTAVEGSCVEIKCQLSRAVQHTGAYWFWIKNATWIEGKSYFDGTIIYSSDPTKRAVSPDYASKARYLGGRTLRSRSSCGILICNLIKTDSGNYSLRYVGNERWRTEDVNLTVTENPCPLTFEKPPTVNESGTIELTCSTLSSCPSYPIIQDLKGPDMRDSKPVGGGQKSTTAKITVSMEDDGKEYSCQTHDNKDSSLIQNVSVTVEYAPRDVRVRMNPDPIMEGKSVNLICSAKGRPAPTFTWFKKLNNGFKEVFSGAEWKIQAINDSQSGEYLCQAQNIYNQRESEPVTINVTYKPEVEVNMTSPPSSSSTRAVVKEGDEMTLTCNVKRSKPQPQSYVWSKDGTEIGQTQIHIVNSVTPEHRGTYECRATNNVGDGTSQLQIEVEYRPRNTYITKYDKVKVNQPLTFTCDTDANPQPEKYSWYRYNKDKKTDSLMWKSTTTTTNKLHLERVQREDEACYTCNATNRIDAGDNSSPTCIRVLYPPTKIKLTLDKSTEVTEGQRITISCTAESFPPSDLTVIKTSTSPSSSSEKFSQDYYNTLQCTLNVTSTDAGSYICHAKNTEGSGRSTTEKLVVKYRPKNVKVNADPDFVVNENTSLTLSCHAETFPSVTSVTWMKMTDWKSEFIKDEFIKDKKFTLSSVSPSDSGSYICEASNEIGTGKSEQAEVKVKYAPKHTEIIRAAEQQQPDGRSSVVLSCSSHSYPDVTQYTWYKKGTEGDLRVSTQQNFTVYSDTPGLYYCTAKNEINERSSDPVKLFVNRGLLMALKICIPLLIILLIVLIILVYRHKRKKSYYQGTTSRVPSFAVLGWWNGTRRRDQMNELVTAEPFRSRDDLLPDQPCRPNGERRQPRPDSTPAANISSVYCTVNLPAGKNGPSAQKPIRQKGGHTEDNSLNYASLHFGNEPKNKQAKGEQDVVYAMVSKQTPPNKREQGGLEDYENVSAMHAAKHPDPLSEESDTSSDEEDLSYTQVNFVAKPGHERSSSDSTSSDEERTQYSDVKL